MDIDDEEPWLRAEVSGARPEPLELTLHNLEKLLDKGRAQVRDALSLIQSVKPS
jgi:hypothetical protein